MDDIEKYTNLLSSVHKNNRWEAALMLGLAGDSKAFEPLKKSLHNDNITVLERVFIISALGWVGDSKAINILVNALSDTDYRIRVTAAKSLGWIGDPRAVGSLLKALDDIDYRVRITAAKSLGWIGDPKGVGSLLHALGDIDYRVRITAAKSLGLIGDRKAIEPLNAHLNDLDYRIRLQCEESIEGIQQGYTGIRFSTNAKNREEDVCQIASTLLGSIINYNSIKPILNQFINNHCAAGNNNKSISNQIGTNEEIKTLIEALKDKDDRLRGYAAYALGWIGDLSAVDPLINAMLADKNKNVSTFAANSLGKIGDIRSIDALINALKNKNHPARDRAALALGQIGDTRAVPDLISAFKHEEVFVQESILVALGIIGDVHAIGLLKSISLEKSERLCTQSLQSLKNIHKPGRIHPFINF